MSTTQNFVFIHNSHIRIYTTLTDIVSAAWVNSAYLSGNISEAWKVEMALQNCTGIAAVRSSISTP